MGHDVGMWIGYALAADYPQEVENLAVTEALIPGVSEFPNLMEPIASQKAHFLFNQLNDLPEYLIEGREEGYLRYIINSNTILTC